VHRDAQILVAVASRMRTISPMNEPRFPRRSGTERRKNRARLSHDFEVERRKLGLGDLAFVYEEEKDLFRWTDGRFAFSREHAD
jgi:(p)ppGpp synthase/HD superfamily hydrolase